MSLKDWTYTSEGTLEADCSWSDPEGAAEINIMKKIQDYCFEYCDELKAQFEAAAAYKSGDISEKVFDMVWNARVNKCDSCKFGKALEEIGGTKDE